MRLRFHSWKQDTPEYVGHASVLEYIQDFAQTHELQKLISFNSRVENIEKRGSRWAVRVWTLKKTHDKKAVYSVQERVRSITFYEINILIAISYLTLS